MSISGEPPLTMTGEVQLMGSADSGLIPQTLNHSTGRTTHSIVPNARHIKDYCCDDMTDGKHTENTLTHTQKKNALQDYGNRVILPHFSQEPREQLLYDS